MIFVPGATRLRTLKAIASPHLALNWDPGNAVMCGELDAFPAAWEILPKNRIHHCHCKNGVKNAAGKIEWAPVDKGYIDWTAQFRALKQIGYHDAVSLETRWREGRNIRGIDPNQLGRHEARPVECGNSLGSQHGHLDNLNHDRSAQTFIGLMET